MFRQAAPSEQLPAAEWFWTYNHERPNIAIGGITPSSEAEMANGSATRRVSSTPNPLQKRGILESIMHVAQRDWLF
jgi:hypothetical protein